MYNNDKNIGIYIYTLYIFNPSTLPGGQPVLRRRIDNAWERRAPRAGLRENDRRPHPLPLLKQRGYLAPKKQPPPLGPP